MKVKFCRISTVYVRLLLSKYVLHFNGKYRVWRILLRAAYSSRVEGWKNPRDVLKTTLNSGCVLSLASLAASEADLSAKRRCFPQLLNVTKASTVVVLKETTKVKWQFFGQDICWRVSKLRRLGILLKAVKCRVRKPLSIPASTPNIYFQPRAISTHSICSSWWLSFTPKRSPLSLLLLPLHWYSGLDFTSSSPHVE